MLNIYDVGNMDCFEIFLLIESRIFSVTLIQKPTRKQPQWKSFSCFSLSCNNSKWTGGMATSKTCWVPDFGSQTDLKNVIFKE